MTGFDQKCPRCAGEHVIIACPFLKAIEFEDGDDRMIRRLEFLTPADYPKQQQTSQIEPTYPTLGKKNF